MAERTQQTAPQIGPTFGAPRRSGPVRELSPLAAIYRLQDMATAYRRSILLLTAHQLGVFVALHETPRSSTALAKVLRCDATALGVLLEALQPLGLITRRGTSWRLTPIARTTLVPSSPHYQGDVMNLQAGLFSHWSYMPAIMKHGVPVWALPDDAVGLVSRADDDAVHPAASALAPPPSNDDARDEMATFIRAMENIALPRLPAVMPHIPLRGVKRVLDVGCGPGTYAIAFAQASPSLEVVAFDRPIAADIAAERAAAAGVADRVSTRAGDFLRDDLGRGFDLVFVSNILHGLGERDALTVLRKARRALAPGGRLVIQEFVTNNARNGTAAALFFAVNMMVTTQGGTAYSARELAALCARAGFGRARSIRLDDPSALLIARRA